MFNVFIACLIVLKLSTLFSMHAFWFRLTDIHVFTSFRIYCCSFNFLYVTCHCLYLHAWTTSLDHAHVWLPNMHATWLYHIYSLAWLHLRILDPHVQILESGPWWPYCSWSECVALWWSECSRSLDVAVALPPSSSPDWLSRPLLLLLSTSQLLLCISLCIMYFCVFWWCNIPIILYHSLW